MNFLLKKSCTNEWNICIFQEFKFMYIYRLVFFFFILRKHKSAFSVTHLVKLNSEILKYIGFGFTIIILE